MSLSTNYKCDCCSFSSQCELCFRHHMLSGYLSMDENKHKMHRAWASDEHDLKLFFDKENYGLCSKCMNKL